VVLPVADQLEMEEGFVSSGALGSTGLSRRHEPRAMGRNLE